MRIDGLARRRDDDVTRGPAALRRDESPAVEAREQFEVSIHANTLAGS